MTLQLDDRQRAMLEEMGIRLAWLPRAGTPAVEAPAPVSAPAPAARAAAQPAPPPAVPRVVVPRAAAEPVVARMAPTAAPGHRPEGIATMDWPSLAQAVAGCQACGLCASRRSTVFGVGPLDARWMVVGEAPGEQEDLQGEPFVGQAGRLLDNMLAALGLDRQRSVYIANVLKCRPPGNRNPEPQEVAQCEPYLRRQVDLLRPRIILAMGRFAVQSLLQTTEPIGRLRGRVHHYQGVPVVVTYHPAYLLRNLPDKAKAWADLCLARSVHDAEAPPG